MKIMANGSNFINGDKRNWVIVCDDEVSKMRKKGYYVHDCWVYLTEEQKDILIKARLDGDY